MATDITKLDYAVVLKKAVEMRDLADDIINMLVPDGDDAPACRHPANQIAEPDTMDDDAMYRCNACGLQQAHPFISEA